VRNTHSNLCIIFVIAGNFDEIRTRTGVVVSILQPKLRERKETIRNEGKHESNEKAKTRKLDHPWASAEIFRGRQRRHFVFIIFK